MKASKLRYFLRKGRKMKCNKCPIPRATCDGISKDLWGKKKCLLRVVLREILVFHTEDMKRGRVRQTQVTAPAMRRRKPPRLTQIRKVCKHPTTERKTGLLPNPDEVWEWCPTCKTLVRKIE